MPDMGMYTELNFNVELKEDTPKEIIDLLRYMVGDEVSEPAELPEHDLFGDTRWRYMLVSTSYYFAPAVAKTELIEDSLAKAVYLSVLCNLKNYSNEIELFLDWIMPYVEARQSGFLGYWRYEGDEHPTLIFRKDWTNPG